jgi:hypothetical protein
VDENSFFSSVSGRPQGGGGVIEHISLETGAWMGRRGRSFIHSLSTLLWALLPPAAEDAARTGDKNFAPLMKLP